MSMQKLLALRLSSSIFPKMLWQLIMDEVCYGEGTDWERCGLEESGPAWIKLCESWSPWTRLETSHHLLLRVSLDVLPALILPLSSLLSSVADFFQRYPDWSLFPHLPCWRTSMELHCLSCKPLVATSKLVSLLLLPAAPIPSTAGGDVWKCKQTTSWLLHPPLKWLPLHLE